MVAYPGQTLVLALGKVAPVSVVVCVMGCASPRDETAHVVSDICSDPRVIAERERWRPKPTADLPACDASTITFREGEEDTEIAVARVLRRYVISGDMVWAEMESLVRLPDNRVANLGEKAPVPIAQYHAQNYLTEALDMNAGANGQPCCFEVKKFYKPVLESDQRGYCVTYYMKPPFTGSFGHCNIHDKMEGEVGYADGVLTWQQAFDIMCQLADRSSSGDCLVRDMRLAADERGDAVYEGVVLRFLTRQTPATFKHFTYRVAAVGDGMATLVTANPN